METFTTALYNFCDNYNEVRIIHEFQCSHGTDLFIAINTVKVINKSIMYANLHGSIHLYSQWYKNR
jgi:hypothetical protein